MIIALLKPSICINATTIFGGEERRYKSQRSPMLRPSGTNSFWVFLSTFIRKHVTPYPLPEVPKIITVEREPEPSVDGMVP